MVRTVDLAELNPRGLIGMVAFFLRSHVFIHSWYDMFVHGQYVGNFIDQSVELLARMDLFNKSDKNWTVNTSYQIFCCTECEKTKQEIWQKLSVKVACTGNVVKFAMNRLPTTCKVWHVNLESPRCPHGQFRGSDRPQPKWFVRDFLTCPTNNLPTFTFRDSVMTKLTGQVLRLRTLRVWTDGMAEIDSVVQAPTVRRLCTFGHPLLALLKVVCKDDLRKHSQKRLYSTASVGVGGKVLSLASFFVSYPTIIYWRTLRWFSVLMNKIVPYVAPEFGRGEFWKTMGLLFC